MQVQNKYTTRNGSLSEMIARALSGCEYDRGAVEEASATADNATGAIGELIEILVEKGVISLEDVGRLAYRLQDLEEVKS